MCGNLKGSYWGLSSKVCKFFFTPLYAIAQVKVLAEIIENVKREPH